MKLDKIHIFIDESGDFGTKGLPGSSLFVVIVGLVFINTKELEKCRLKIEELKTSLRLSENFEFKFSKLSNKIRKMFILHLSECHYEIFFSYKNKKDFIGSPLELYFHLYKNLLDQLMIFSNPIYMEIDGVIDRRRKREIISFLRKILYRNKIKITFVNSKNSSLIQFADIIAGSMRVHYEFSNTEFINLFKKKIISKKKDSL